MTYNGLPDESQMIPRVEYRRVLDELLRLNNLMKEVCSVVTAAWGDNEDGFEDDEPQARLFAILEKWLPESK